MNQLTQQIVHSVVKALKDIDHQELILEVASELEKIAKNQGQTQVTSAVELTNDQKDKIRYKLEALQIEFTVDSNILGGLIIEHDGKRQDLSLRKRLNLVKRVIAE